MGFFIKKFISQFLMPIPLIFEFLIIGWLLTRFSRFKKTGRCSTGLAVLMFIFFSYGIGAKNYLYRLERLYQPVELDAENRMVLRGSSVVVLGQGVPDGSNLPLRYQTGSSFQMRLQEGLRLCRQISDAQMFVSLAGEADRQKKTQYLCDYAQEHGLNRERIHLISTARDTADEARLSLGLINTNYVIVVTSASHLPRAIKIFSKELRRRQRPFSVLGAGVMPKASGDARLGQMIVPAPCDYSSAAPPEFVFHWWALPLPSVDGLCVTQQALYEWLGNLHEDLID